MLDIGWAELLVVGVVALLVVGPKELPGLLRTIGKYLGMARRQANEFKQQFNEAIKDTELDDIRKEVDAIRTDTASTIRDVQSSVSVSDRDIGASSTDASVAAVDNADPTWMTGDTQPSPAETAARAAAERAQAMRVSDAVTAAPAADANASTATGAEQHADKPSAVSAVNGASRPQSADAGA